jgi:hypothetical protein
MAGASACSDNGEQIAIDRGLGFEGRGEGNLGAVEEFACTGVAAVDASGGREDIATPITVFFN